MPVKNGKDTKGFFYRWGTRTKYYYVPGNVKSRNTAKAKADKQGVAINISKAVCKCKH
jgi:hypothetical protein